MSTKQQLAQAQRAIADMERNEKEFCLMVFSFSGGDLKANPHPTPLDALNSVEAMGRAVAARKGD